MYTWGYIKENTLSKLGIDEQAANELGFLSNFSYYANEAMTQICSAVKPKECYYRLVITQENVNMPITMPEEFLAFSDDILLYQANEHEPCYEVGDEFMKYHGYNQVICKYTGIYHIPYRARWFFFTKDLHNATVVPAPADVCDALPSYMASQCFKIDDEAKAAIYRNEFEMFLARMDDTSFKSQRTFHIGGGW